MDPNRALEDAREAVRHWLHVKGGDQDLEMFDQLVSSFEALDRWISRGGFLPRDWSKNVLHDVTPSVD